MKRDVEIDIFAGLKAVGWRTAGDTAVLLVVADWRGNM